MKAEGVRQAREHLSKDDEDFKALKGFCLREDLIGMGRKACAR
jgi:hypothetical protein